MQTFRCQCQCLERRPMPPTQQHRRLEKRPRNHRKQEWTPTLNRPRLLKRDQRVGQSWHQRLCPQHRFVISDQYPPTFCRLLIGKWSFQFLVYSSSMFSFFSRFLPCSSHHIRDNTANQQQHQNQQTQTIHVRPVQRRAVSLDRSSIRQPAATLHVPTRLQQAQPTNSANRGRSLIDNVTDEDLNHRFSLFGIQLSLRDLESLAPSFYNEQRNDLRTFLRQNFFNNSDINEQTVTVAIREILQSLDTYLERLSVFTHPDYDVRKSVENLIMKSLPFIINLITDDNSSEFGVRIERQLITFCEQVYMILVKCIGVQNTEKYLVEIASRVMIGGTSNTGALRRFPESIIQTFLIERRSYDLSEIQEYLIIKRPSAPTVS